jgi:hypothetical protein
MKWIKQNNNFGNLNDCRFLFIKINTLKQFIKIKRKDWKNTSKPDILLLMFLFIKFKNFKQKEGHHEYI